MGDRSRRGGRLGGPRRGGRRRWRRPCLIDTDDRVKADAPRSAAIGPPGVLIGPFESAAALDPWRAPPRPAVTGLGLLPEINGRGNPGSSRPQSRFIRDGPGHRNVWGATGSVRGTRAARARVPRTEPVAPNHLGPPCPENETAVFPAIGFDGLAPRCATCGMPRRPRNREPVSGSLPRAKEVLDGPDFSPVPYCIQSLESTGSCLKIGGRVLPAGVMSLGPDDPVDLSEMKWPEPSHMTDVDAAGVTAGRRRGSCPLRPGSRRS